MLTYEDLVASLEDAWVAAGLHEHALVESVVPSVHDRSYRVELFPEHSDPLTAENIPPWVEVNFTWSALHQIRSEHRNIDSEPLDLIWTYTVSAPGMHDHKDSELVRLFQKAFHRAFQRFYPEEAAEVDAPAVEVRRIYQWDRAGQRPKPAYIQLVSTNITDLSEQWEERDPRVLANLIQTEVHFAGAFIRALADAFNPGGRGGYRTVDAA